LPWAISQKSLPRINKITKNFAIKLDAPHKTKPVKRTISKSKIRKINRSVTNLSLIDGSEPRGAKKPLSKICGTIYVSSIPPIRVFNNPPAIITTNKIRGVKSNLCFKLMFAVKQ
jgi:hypothetical protein